MRRVRGHALQLGCHDILNVHVYIALHIQTTLIISAPTTSMHPELLHSRRTCSQPSGCEIPNSFVSTTQHCPRLGTNTSSRTRGAATSGCSPPPSKYDGQFPCRPQLNLGLTQLAHTPGVESEKYFLELDIEIEIIVGPP